jgi:peptidyl-prolyl cis-trans isomerase B (cyclophilin B)
MMRPLLAPLVAAVALSAPVHAQLTPTRLYYGIDRSMPMSVAVPPGAAGDVIIELFAPAPLVPPGAAPPPKSEPLASAPAVPGVIDLATRFPSLWSADHPRLLYAQLSVGARRVGPPVVLEPMVTPNMAMLVDRGTFAPVSDPAAGVVMFDDERHEKLAGIGKKPEPRIVVYSGLRAYVDKHVVLDTTLGPVEFQLRPDQAPITAWNFRQLAEGGFYTDIIFHRVVANTDIGAPFVIQTGDPNGSGDGGPGYNIDLEPSRLPHDFGVLSMARDTDPNTNGSQVFIALSREATARLDGRYTAFGQAVRGAETIIAIEKVELLPESPPQPGDPAPGPKNRPKAPPVIRSACLVDAPPFGEGPPPVTRPSPPVSR